MDGDGGGCDSDRGMSNTRLAARANHAVAAELHTTCGISKLEDVQDRAPDCVLIRGPLFTSGLDETQPFHKLKKQKKQEMHTNISNHPHSAPRSRPAAGKSLATRPGPRSQLRAPGARSARTGRTRALSSTRPNVLYHAAPRIRTAVVM
jgi:hypothetical protein